jgi:hypothetical protein
MRTFRTSTGPFSERPFYSDEEIERICSDALAEAGFLPTAPGKVRIERFIEKRFNVRVIFEQLDAGVLGFTEFGAKGVESVHVAEPDEATVAADRRVNSTLAHEAGHGLLHTHLFLPEFDHKRLFASDPDVGPNCVLCRDDEQPVRSRLRTYDGRWWEFQANRTIGALLMPKQVFLDFMAPFLERRGTFGLAALPDSSREEAIRATADVFDVNPAAARVRLDGLFPREGHQLTL